PRRVPVPELRACCGGRAPPAQPRVRATGRRAHRRSAHGRTRWAHTVGRTRRTRSGTRRFDRGRPPGAPAGSGPVRGAVRGGDRTSVSVWSRVPGAVGYG